MIKEVVFDIDDTLYDYEKGHALGVERMAEYAEKELGIAKAYFRSEYKRMNEELKVRLGKDDAATHSRSIRLQNLLEQWGKPLFPHVEKLYHLYWDALLAESKAEPGSIEADTGASENGHRRGNRHGYDLPDAVSEAGASLDLHPISPIW